MWAVPSQHSGVRAGQGVQPEEPAHDTPAGQTHIRAALVWTHAQAGPPHGATDTKSTGAEGICVQGGGTVS